MDGTPNRHRTHNACRDKERLQRITPPIERVSAPWGTGEWVRLPPPNRVSDTPHCEQWHDQENVQAQNRIGVGMTEPVWSHGIVATQQRESYQDRVEENPEILHTHFYSLATLRFPKHAAGREKSAAFEHIYWKGHSRDLAWRRRPRSSVRAA